MMMATLRRRCRRIAWNSRKHLAKIGGRFLQLALGSQRVGQVVAGIGIVGLNAKGVPELLRGLIEPGVGFERHAQGIQGSGLLWLAAQCVPQVCNGGWDLLAA